MPPRYTDEFKIDAIKHIKYIISCDLFFFLSCKLLFQCIRSFLLVNNTDIKNV